MGTKGYIVIKFQNKYYAIYSHFDSYPSYLGDRVDYIIKKLKQAKIFGQSEECLKNLIDYFTGINHQPVEDGDVELDVFIQWIYNIDLDTMLLTIKNEKINKVYNILELNEKWLDELIFH